MLLNYTNISLDGEIGCPRTESESGPIYAQAELV